MLDFESFLQYVKDNIKDYLPSEFADANVETIFELDKYSNENFYVFFHLCSI